MSPLATLPWLWSAIDLPGLALKYRPYLAWWQVFGDPNLSLPGLLGGLITWIKVVSIFCLIGWVVSWVAAGIRERTAARGGPLDIAAAIALLLGCGAVALNVLETTKRLEHVPTLRGLSLITLLGMVSGAVLFVWLEATLWRSLRRIGRPSDLAVLGGIQLGLFLGVAVGVLLQQSTLRDAAPNQVSSWRDGVVYGSRLSATYMGYVVLARVLLSLAVEVVGLRWRRLYAIAWHTVVEANRRMWAPYVVIVVFGVVLAFTHWFLVPPRAAEMGRLFVGTLALLCSLLLTVMVTLLTPLSLPSDIQHQTIYTIVTKPVRRIELVWGRMLGFMAIVTVLVLVFGGISLIYLRRTVGGTIDATVAAAVKARQAGRTADARQFEEQAGQMRTRMAAREPVKGSLTFLDSLGNPHLRGIDVGQEQSMREPRSHIEGATPATAIWRFGKVPDPYNPQHYLNRLIPVARLLRPGTVEALQNHALELQSQIAADEREQAAGKATPARAKLLAGRLDRNRAQVQSARAEYDRLRADVEAIETKAAAAGDTPEARSLRQQAAALHSPAIPVEMTFNIFRTTKGQVGEAVWAELQATNPFTGASYRDLFPIREYYTNRKLLPASLLAGSLGALTIEVRCVTPTQYLGMAESDLYLLARSGNFGTNYMKGLFGVWLQALVLTAIGVFAGTFLSWPVALLTTIFFFIAGQVAFNVLLEFSMASLLGGGPFESLIRLIGHDNQMTDLAPTAAVVTAKTLDSLVMPVMSRLVYIIPNFSALDVSNTVADGFEVRWALMGTNLLLAVAYALPFSIAGYFLLKNREVAA